MVRNLLKRLILWALDETPKQEEYPVLTARVIDEWVNGYNGGANE